MHQRDNDQLLATLKRLRDLGNSVIVVEHDEDAIHQADYLVDMGPGAGIHGGTIVSQGTPKQVMEDDTSLTGQYLIGKRKIPVPIQRRRHKKEHYLHLTKASGNNLKNVDVSIPLSTFTCITGVSGGGKSTLILETLYKAVSRKLNNSRLSPAHIKI